MRETVFANIEGRKIFVGWIEGEVFEGDNREKSF